MPIPVTCPTRRRTFRVADRYAGRRGLCPGCRGVVAVPDTDLEPLEPVGEESAYDDRPRRARWNPERPPSRLDHLPAWRRIGLGFLIQQAAAGLYLVALALVGAAAVVLPDDPLDFDRQPTPGEVVAGAVGV